MPCSTASWQVPRIARSEGQRLAYTSAAAPLCTIRMPPAACPALTSVASFLTTGTIWAAVLWMSSGFRLDSFSIIPIAALAGPQGPSHHQRNDDDPQHGPECSAHFEQQASAFVESPLGAVALEMVTPFPPGLPTSL